MYVKLLTNFLLEKAVGKSESKDVHLAVLRGGPKSYVRVLTQSNTLTIAREQMESVAAME